MRKWARSDFLSFIVHSNIRRLNESAGKEIEKNKSRGVGQDLYSVQQRVGRRSGKITPLLTKKQKSDANW
jgi:hypothetical protein